MSKKSQQDKEIDILGALGQESRYRIFKIIKKKKNGIKRAILPSLLGIEDTLLSSHLRILREAGLLVSDKIGRFVMYSVNPKIVDLTILN